MCFGVGTVGIGQLQGLADGHFYLWNVVFGYHLQGDGLRQSQEGAQLLCGILHGSLRVQQVGFLVEFVDFQLEHLVLCDGPDAVSAFSVAEQGVGRGIVGFGDIPFRLG